MSKCVEDRSMTVRDAIYALGVEPTGFRPPRQRLFANVARRVGLSYRAVRCAFYGEVGSEHRVVQKILGAARTNGQIEAEQLAGKFEAVVAGLLASDENFHRESIDALLHAARSLRDVYRPRNMESEQ